MEKEAADAAEAADSAEMERLFNEHYPGSILVVDSSPDVTFLDM